MEKIPTLFKRDPEDMRHVLPEVTPGCEWVLAGQGVATRKYDGTCFMVSDNDDWLARREVKPDRAAPLNFEPISTDENTGKTIGWEPALQSPFAKYLMEALAHGDLGACPPGTYELCGPKINGNPEGLDDHRLIRHAAAQRVDHIDPSCAHCLSFDGLAAVIVLLGARGWEGIVWHHADGRMAKLKRRDFP